MKIRWYDRLLSILCGLLLIALGVCAIIAGGGTAQTLLGDTELARAIDQAVWTNWQLQPLIVVLGIVVALLGLLLVVRAFRHSKGVHGRYYMLQKAEDGNVRISVAAIESLVKKCLEQYPQIISSRTKIGGNEENMELTLHITLHTDVQIPGLIEDVRAQIRQTLERSAGVIVKKVEVYVDATKSGPPAEDVRYIEARPQPQETAEAPDAPEPAYINTAAFDKTPVVITDEAEDAPQAVPTVETFKEQMPPLRSEPLPVELSEEAFPFPEVDLPQEDGPKEDDSDA